MLIEILIFLLLGIIAGTLTGLFPGVHINLVGAFLVALSVTAFSSINPLFLAVFIVSMAIAHTFLDFIPSIFLGCPNDDDTGLSVLPGHEMLKKGQGYEAVILTAYGCLMAVFTLLLTSFPLVFIMNRIYDFLKTKYVMAGILILIAILLITSEKGKAKFKALLVFLLTGALGLIVLNFKPLSQPLLPLLSGLFGASSIILSIKNKIQIPKQVITKPDFRETLKPLSKAFLGSLISSPVCGFLPGLGSGQAAVIGNQITKTDRRGFLILLGATNILVMGFSFISLYAISKTRTGAAAAVSELLGNFSWKILFLFVVVIFISGIVSFFLTKFFAEFFSRRITKLSYTKISIATLLVLGIIVTVVSGFLGLVILAVSTLTGIYCISLNVKRTNMMGCLLLSTILFYVGIVI
ncbi:MAG TPA: tripartite tricarboxylate transporter permease [Patescibacteria group bacterium]|nr:tripartite tricarboxylate transporter permease [Patescibacteria group bacterium]